MVEASQQETVSEIVNKILSKKTRSSSGVKEDIILQPRTPLSSAFRGASRYLGAINPESLDQIKRTYLSEEDLIFNLSGRVQEDRSIKWDAFVNKQLAKGVSSDAMSNWYNSVNTVSTGLIPANVKFFHKFMDRIRIVLEIPPGVSLVWWGQTERSEKNQFMLATPYRFVIADFIANANFGVSGYQLWGARVFYSVKPLVSWDQILYHTNFNNTNCLGYIGTSIGWVCLYHRNEKLLTLKDMVNCIMNRVGGGEAYNETNMSQTQGTTFYKQYKPRLKYLHSPEAWEKKSKKVNAWVLDENNWVPVLPSSRDMQESHSKDVSIAPLTIGEAVFSPAPMYYPHRGGATPISFVDSMIKAEFCDYISDYKPQTNLFNEVLLGSLKGK